MGSRPSLSLNRQNKHLSVCSHTNTVTLEAGVNLSAELGDRGGKLLTAVGKVCKTPVPSSDTS